MSRKRVNTFNVEPFVNHIGQTLNSGDRVVAVTTGYSHRVNTFEGIFEGVYRGANQEISGTRIGLVPVKWLEQVFSDDGEIVQTEYKRKYDANGRYIGTERVPTGRRYNLVPRVRYRRSVLRRNRVFKIDTTPAK